MAEQTKITVEVYTPADIMQWNTADPGRHTPASENDFRTRGKFKHRMEPKDGSFGFDGTYDKVELYKEIVIPCLTAEQPPPYLQRKKVKPRLQQI